MIYVAACLLRDFHILKNFTQGLSLYTANLALIAISGDQAWADCPLKVPCMSRYYNYDIYRVFTLFKVRICLKSLKILHSRTINEAVLILGRKNCIRIIIRSL